MCGGWNGGEPVSNLGITLDKVVHMWEQITGLSFASMFFVYL